MTIQLTVAQGITVLIGAADTGSAACDNSTTAPAPAKTGLEVNGIASTSYNTAVGGTDFSDDSCTNTLLGSSSSAETNCNDPQLVG